MNKSNEQNVNHFTTRNLKINVNDNNYKQLRYNFSNIAQKSNNCYTNINKEENNNKIIPKITNNNIKYLTPEKSEQNCVKTFYENVKRKKPSNIKINRINDKISYCDILKNQLNSINEKIERIILSIDLQAEKEEINNKILELKNLVNMKIKIKEGY